VSDIIPADYGWLQSLDGKVKAWVTFQPGKNHDGYFDNSNILEQAQIAMDILQEYYLDVNHVLVFDNATTHQKQAEGSISARKMPKNTSKNFLVSVNKCNPMIGKPIYGPDGK
jgi:hypothetical protein